MASCTANLMRFAVGADHLAVEVAGGVPQLQLK
jgi:hypothetical protein